MKIPRLAVAGPSSLMEGPGLPEPALLRAQGAHLSINTASWPGFGPVAVDKSGLLPRTEAWLGHSGGAIHVLFEVVEDGIRATNSQDQDPVWQDSCVELFIAPDTASCPGPTGYYNFEFNCIGRCLAAFGPDRHHRESAPTATMTGISRRASLGDAVLGYRAGVTTWDLQVAIPRGSFFKHQLVDLGGLTMNLNLYKCGDALPRPHYLSWNPITSAQPDFHRPECFSQMAFAD